MWKTIAVAGATAVIIGGVGTAAVAAGATTTPSASSTSPASDSAVTNSSANTSGTQLGKHKAAALLRRAVHATWVTENKKTKVFTTHDAIRGQVTAVSATSITVHAADNVTETYLVSSATKVRSRSNKSAASIADVKAGDPVLVAGTGTTTLMAVHVFDAEK